MKKISKFIVAAGLAAVATVGIAGTAGAAEAAEVAPLDQSTILSLHNTERAKVGTAPLQWDSSLAAASQAYAGQLAAGHPFAHSDTQLGENLAMDGNTDAAALNASMGVEGWIAEKAQYTPGTPGYSHYTQMVSSRGKKVGCGQATSEKNGMTELYLVCRYDPQGSDGKAPY